MAKKLTPKQRQFVDEYLIDLNATQAAVRAGYSEKRASEIGYQLLRKTTVQNAILRAQTERSARTEVTADRVVKELARIAFVDTRQILEWGPIGVRLRPSNELTDDEAAIVADVSETTSEIGGGIRVKRFDKLKALELLGRHLGMFVEKREITGRNGGEIKIGGATTLDVSRKILLDSRASELETELLGRIIAGADVTGGVCVGDIREEVEIPGSPKTTE